MNVRHYEYYITFLVLWTNKNDIVLFIYLLGLGYGWNNVILETEEELDFIKTAMAFFYAHYHGKYILGGSTNISQNNEIIGFSNYFPNSSGRSTFLY